MEQELTGGIDLDDDLPIIPIKKVVAPEKKRGRKTRIERSSIFEQDEYEREMEDRDKASGLSSFDDASEDFDGWSGSKGGGSHDDDDD